MPIIPVYHDSQVLSVNSPVPIAGTSDARISGDSIAQAGAALQKFGKEQVEFDRSLRLQEGTSAINDAVDLGTKYADQNSLPNGSDYAEKFYEVANPKMSQAYDQYGAGDPHLTKQLDSYLVRVKGAADTQNTLKMLSKKEDDNVRRSMDQIGIEADRQRSSPNAQVFGASMRSYGAFLEGVKSQGGLSSRNVENLRNKYYSSMVKAHVDGLVAQQRPGQALSMMLANQEDKNLFTELSPDQAQNMGLITSDEAKAKWASEDVMHKVPVMTKGDKYKLTPELATAMNGLDPQEKERIIEHLRAEAKSQTAIKLSDLNERLSSFSDLSKKGLVNQSDVNDLTKSISIHPNLSPQAKARSIEKVNTDYVVSQALNLAGGTPRSEWGAVQAGLSDKILGSSMGLSKNDPNFKALAGDVVVRDIRSKASDTFMKSLDNLRKQQDEDPAKFVLARDSQLQTLYQGTKDNTPEGTANYLRASLAAQAHLGLRPRILGKEEASQMAQGMLSIPDTANTHDFLNSVQAKYGSYFPQVMTEMAGKNKSLESYRATIFADPSTRLNLVDGIKNAPKIEAGFKDLADDSLKKEVAQASQAVMSEYRKSIVESSPDSSGVGLVNTMQDQVELQVKRDLVRGAGSGDPKELAQRAYDSLIGSTYQTVSGGSSTVLVPRKIDKLGINPRTVQKYIDYYSSADHFKDLNIAVPPKFKGSGGNVLTPNSVSDLIPKTAEENYLDYVASSHRWVTNSDQTGIKLVRMNPDGSMEQQFDKSGKPIIKTYTGIHNDPGENVTKYKSTFLGGIFGY